jgi:ribonuclease BN (tRNA processing enzyme)
MCNFNKVILRREKRMGILKFLGRGSAFNSKEGNTSAFIKKDNNLLLIDCGEDIFDRCIEAKLLDGVDIINVLITHLHPDHVGSLGTFIFYCYYMKNLRINVYYEDVNTLELLLSLQGVDRSQYNLDVCSKINDIDKMGISLIEPFKTEHVPNLKSFGYKINMMDSRKAVYFGDTNDLPCNMIEMLKVDKKMEVYIDTSLADYPNSPHLSLKKLCEKAPQEVRSNIFCIHYDSEELLEAVKLNGFSIVENVI